MAYLYNEISLWKRKFQFLVSLWPSLVCKWESNFCAYGGSIIVELGKKYFGIFLTLTKGTRKVWLAKDLRTFNFFEHP